jgi:hypothetical protein
VGIQTDSPCDADGSVCTENDACKSGICVPGKTKTCSDNKPCTLDACDKVKGCTYTAEDGKACDDDDPCTVADACAKGACASGAAKKCAGTGPCIIGQCDPTDGKCAYKKLTAACNDDNACTEKDTCDVGFCVGSAVDCNDGNPCTADTCGKTNGCVHTPNNAPCNDGSNCTAGDACKGGKCVGLAGDVTQTCSDNNPCTLDTCAKETGCVHTAVPSSCDADGNKCTQNDACVGGTCVAGKAAKCDDANPCTTDSCNKAAGCAHLLNTAKCDDGDACTAADACAKGACVPGKPAVCEDGNACTVNSCDKAKGCVAKALTGKTFACYSGAAGSQGTGTCKGGDKACKADGTLGQCVGEVVPAVQEACDGLDDNCDGKTDVGCSVSDFRVVQGGAYLSGTAGDKQLRAMVGAGGVGGSGVGGVGSKHGVKLGLYVWLRARLAK